MNTQLSKFLSYILRHRPDSIGITLDENGWADVHELISKSTEKITLEEIVDVVENNNKKRFTLDMSQNRIRAAQGHSINVNLELKSKRPPAILFHGTVNKFLTTILKEGLKPMSRQHVHLSANEDTAADVASRRGKPIILKIDCNTMLLKGYEFYQSENGVWLTEHVPPFAISQ